MIFCYCLSGIFIMYITHFVPHVLIFANPESTCVWSIKIDQNNRKLFRKPSFKCCPLFDVFPLLNIALSSILHFHLLKTNCCVLPSRYYAKCTIRLLMPSMRQVHFANQQNIFSATYFYNSLSVGGIVCMGERRGHLTCNGIKLLNTIHKSKL